MLRLRTRSVRATLAHTQTHGRCNMLQVLCSRHLEATVSKVQTRARRMCLRASRTRSRRSADAAEASNVHSIKIVAQTPAP